MTHDVEDKWVASKGGTRTRTQMPTKEKVVLEDIQWELPPMFLHRLTPSMLKEMPMMRVSSTREGQLSTVWNAVHSRRTAHGARRNCGMETTAAGVDNVETCH